MPRSPANRHGTTTGYRYGCRCEECTKANAFAQSVYYERNRERQQARQRKYDQEKARTRPAEVRAKQRKDRLRQLYGMTVEDWDALIINQLGCCAACGDQLMEQRSCVDHDHVTGAVRGILCVFCNSADGMLKGDPDRALRLAAYLLSTSDVLVSTSGMS